MPPRFEIVSRVATYKVPILLSSDNLPFSVKHTLVARVKAKVCVSVLRTCFPDLLVKYKCFFPTAFLISYVP